MTAAHLDGVCAIENECFAHPWSRGSLENALSDPNAVFCVAIENGGVIGYIGMLFVLDEGYVGNLAVRPDRRREGIGAALVDAMAAEARVHALAFLTLEVRESNFPARKLYESRGYETVGVRKNYYEKPKEDAVLMTCAFP